MKDIQIHAIGASHIFLSVAALCLVLVLIPTTNTLLQIRKLQEAVDAETKIIQQADLLSEQVSGLKRQHYNEQSLAEHMDAKIPPTENLPELVSELSSIANQAGVIITALTPALPVELDQGGQQIPLEVILQGPYNNIKTYLDLLETTNRYVAVEAIKLSQAQNQDTHELNTQGHLWTAHLCLSTFFWPPLNS